MDSLLKKISSSMNDHQSVPVCSSRNVVNELAPSSTMSSEGDPHPEGNDYKAYSNVMLKYISEILMEEDLGGKTCMFQDYMALQAAERSFYDVLGAKYPPSSNEPHPPSVEQNVNGPDDIFTRNCSNCNSTANKLLEPNLVPHLGQFESSHAQTPFIDTAVISTLQSHSPLLTTPRSFCDSVDGLEDSPLSTLLATKIPPNGNRVIIDLDPEEKTPDIVVGKAEKEKRYNSPNGSNGRKNHHREDGDSLEEGRRNKHLEFYTEVSEQVEMFDKVLLCSAEDDCSERCIVDDSLENEASRRLQHQNGQSKGSNGGTSRGKKRGNKREMVDLSTLLTLCAEAVAGNDHKTTTELLKQIRQHSSPCGDGCQRLAHYFANALEARLDGMKTQLYTFLANRTSAADMLKAYHRYVLACPFKTMSNFFGNRKISNLSEKATRLHIIDFGISYGFQWPCLIQRLSERAGGPPKLRITGIELPQPGFRPAERVEETGCRLATYCERFNVPFEYFAIAKKWETIQLEDLKIDRDEVLVVNSMFRMRTLLDETVVVESPRDAVLKLIKRINPDIFIHGVINGNYNAALFARRFKETLFHFSALFDMFDNTMPRENQERMLFEKEIFGRDAMNIIACEGSQRLDRPETYKQWQVRNVRAGFRQLPLDRDIVRKVKAMVKVGYNKEYVVDEDGQWLLLGWKGRILQALSYWKPC